MQSPLRLICLLALNFITTVSLHIHDQLTTAAIIGNVSIAKPMNIGDVSIWFDRNPNISCHDFQKYIVKRKKTKHGIASGLAWKYTKASDLCMVPASPSVSPFWTKSTDKPIQFLHVSKAGGTLICRCGNNAGKNAGLNHTWSVNCHFLSEDWPMWGPHDVPWWGKVPPKDPKTRDCDQLARKYKTNDPAEITLEGNENYLAMGGNLCPQFLNVVVLRNPIHRLLSHIVQIHYKNPNSIKNHTVTDFFNKWPLITDNYFIRSLGGSEFYRLPFGKVGKSQLLRAEAVLQKFDDIFIVDDGLARTLQTRFQWSSCKGNEGRTSIFKGGTQGVVDYFKATWKSTDWQRLVHQNKWDIELWQQGRMINKANSILFEHSCSVSHCPRSPSTSAKRVPN